MKAMLVAMVAAVAMLANPLAAEPRQVRIAYITSELSPGHVNARLFSEAMEKRMPGVFAFKLYPNGQLGGEEALIDSLQAGSLEMGILASGMTKVVRKVGVFDLPWLFDDRAHVRRALAGPLGEQVFKEVEKRSGMTPLGIYENGFRHVINSKRAIVTPADMKGLKIRVAGGKVRRALFAAMGANPAPVDWTETFTAMQTGVVDGAEAGIYGFYEAKLGEVGKYLSLTKHIYSPSFMMASNAFVASLTPDQRKAMREVSVAITDAVFNESESNENKFMEEMRKMVQINEVDLASFRTQTDKVYKDFIADQGDDWIKLIRAAR
ncbi:MAG: TRAP transporter substrate-binding protein [Alphaproteobacteria bacterium]